MASTFQAEALRVAQGFEVTREEIRRATSHFCRQMKSGLQDPRNKAEQIPSFVTVVPNGTEKGKYLTADLGGTNFRVCLVELHGNSTYTITAQFKTVVPKSCMVTSSATPLFAFMAAHVLEFLECYQPQYLATKPVKREFYRLGFTFSFTYEQTSLNGGVLQRWDKGFHIPSALGKDPSALLQASLDDMNVPVTVSALVNDTVGTLLARQYSSTGKTILGAVFGTGTNGAYVEKLSRITKLPPSQTTTTAKGANVMAITTEWGSFDDEAHVLPVTAFDLELDRESINPNQQRYEKLLSGMYLGEIFRLALLSVCRTSSGFCKPAGFAESPLHCPYGIPTSLLSVLAEDVGNDISGPKHYLETILQVQGLTKEEFDGIRAIAKAIGQRAARLAGIGVGAVILTTRCLPIGSFASRSIRATKKFVKFLHPFVTFCWVGFLPWMNRLAVTFGRGLFCSLGEMAVGSYEKPFAVAEKLVEDEIIDIGLDGSLAERFPGFVDGLCSALSDIDGIGTAGLHYIRIGMAKDGSSVGAALIAHGIH